ncbi:uncharacterized protein LOC100570990 [Acyrthosiphon pisum]|uniref:Uncharacterized protein n=1 Tax=Acyrthosiphon pisum TaxID=7029 RepID=A0A8R2JPJ8_ACYPI|nr:uncharacterized protein LOC100570990 [Acyrthosiphon pisum]|eukprot:XP_003245442.1 PREDICTED: uncharacterized protein LOC100570990 [Acyrthosiphon pisum]
MMFSKHKAIISSLFVTISLVKLINCADPDPAAPTDLADAAVKPNESDAASNSGTNNPKPAPPTPAVNIVTKPTTTQQSSTTSKKGFSHNFFCNMICTPFNACRTFLGDTIRSFWQSLLKVRESIISIYRPPVTPIKNVGS